MEESRSLGDYRLLKQIGQGSLGLTFVAEHRFTKKTFVLKVLPEELSNDRMFLQRFEDEIALLSSLDHPHIVKIHNVSFSHGVYFLVCDCIVDSMGETTNLNQYFNAKGKKLSQEEILSIVQQVASALDYGHSLTDSAGKCLSHRGLKLNNILIGKDNSVLISDWGLSSIVGVGAALTRTFKGMAEALGISSPSLTAKVGYDRYPQPAIESQKLLPLHMSLIQNFAFLAPEQKRIDAQTSERIDSYAFGVLVYYLLTGVYPEGAFAMPSKLLSEQIIDWDAVVERTLQPYPLLRIDTLHQLLKASVKQEARGETRQEARQGVKQEPEPQAVLATVGAPETKPEPVAAPVEKRISWEREERVVKEYAPEKREHTQFTPILTEMVQIDGGSYYRGSNSGCRDEMPRHRVDVDAFAIDIHPVTNEQFVRFLEFIGGEKDAQNHDIIRIRDSRIKRSAGRISIEPGYNKHPVVGVTWYGAVAYCQWVGKRLPTEAEWEIACAGGLENPLYPTGESIEKTQANFFSSDTTAVMSYPPNGYGLYDLVGNVYEWCQDWYEYTFYEASSQEPDNPKGPLQGVYRVLRGGCWKSLKEDLRTSKRHRNNPGAANGTYGFRCCS